MPKSHIHRSPCRFNNILDITDDPGSTYFLSLIHMHKDVATDLNVSSDDNVDKSHFVT